MFTRCEKVWNGLGGIEGHLNRAEKQKRQQGCWRYMEQSTMLPKLTYTL